MSSVSSPTPARGASESAQPGSERMPWALIVAACLGSFAATSSGTTRAPFLVDIARDLATSVPVIGHLFSLTAIAWGVSSFFAGVGVDLWGRRPFLIGGPIALALALAGVATASDFFEIAVWSTVVGGCAGLFMSAIFTEVSARTADRVRGRALGWVMSGQSLTLLAGVPLAAWLGASIGWRGVNVCVAVVAGVAAVALLATTVQRMPRRLAGHDQPVLTAVFSAQVLRLLGMGIAERICFGLAAVYFATFLLETYRLPLQALALPLMVFALGNVLGTALGGHLADHWRHRLRTFSLAMLASGVVGLALFTWFPSLEFTVGLGFVYGFFNALGRPSLMAALTNVPPEVRGTVMGLNGTCASIGWVGAAALGSWLIATWGYVGFGPLIAALVLVSAVLAAWGEGAAAPARSR